MSDNVGLLGPLADPEGAIVDIIFIHGLAGHREMTWTKFDHFWPKTILPTDVPKARVWSWGYDADILHFWSKRSKPELSSHSKQLCSDLAGVRTGTPNRPIIFVAHSLGGIVCENALVLSTINAEQHIKDIASCTRGIIFLGTPLQGSGKTKWADIGQKFAKLVGQDKNKEVVSILKEDSPRLQELAENFANVLRDRAKTKEAIDVICFYEKFKTTPVGQIVTKDSATIMGYEGQEIPADHHDVCKFASKEDPGYIRISGVLQRWVSDLETSGSVAPLTGISIVMKTNEMKGGDAVGGSIAGWDFGRGGVAMIGNTVLPLGDEVHARTPGGHLVLDQQRTEPVLVSTDNDIDRIVAEILGGPLELTVQRTIAEANEKPPPSGDATLQGLSAPDTAGEGNADSHEDPTAVRHDEGNVDGYIRQSKAQEVSQDRPASLITPASLPNRIPGKQPETPRGSGSHHESGDWPVPRSADTGLLLATRDLGDLVTPPEPMPPSAPRLDNEMVRLGHPQPAPHKDDARSLQLPRPAPKGFIRKLDEKRFCVKTRNRCNDVFEDIISVSTEEEANAFFRDVDRYDPLKGPMRKLSSKLLDLYWTFVPPSHPSPMAIASPEEGIQTLDLTEWAPAGNPPENVPLRSTANEPEFGSNAAGLALAATAAYAAGSRRDSAGPAQPPANEHKVFICLSLGRPDRWRLQHAEFTGRANEPLHITDEAIFNQVRAEMGKFQKSRGYLRFVFPLRLSKVEYHEFTLYNRGTGAIHLGCQGRLPSEHPPPPDDWRERCPADKWYFTAPGVNEKEAVRVSLATPALTDAVLNRAEFADRPGSAQYRKSVPWKLKEELQKDSCTPPLGWGFVLRFEFDMIVFLCIWVTVAVLLSVGLLGLYIAPSGPTHGQPGVTVAIFLAPIGFVGTWFGFACAYGKQRKYLD